FIKMRKSLGEKRKQISADQIAQIVRLYGDFTEGDRVKIFPNESFGFMRITVERPLRLRWEVTEETRALDANAKLAKLLGEAQRAARRAELLGWGDEVFTAKKQAAKRLRDTLVPLGIVGKPIELAVRDPDADPVSDARGNVEPDPELRDYENVPLPAT